MTRLSLQERLKILAEIDLLLLLDSIGWDVKHHLIEQGDMLGSDERPKYMPPDLSIKDYDYYSRMAKRNEIPLRVFNDRLRRGKDPEKAANTPYLKKNGESELPFLEIAKSNNISVQAYHWRRRKGWSQENACTIPLQKERHKRKPDRT